MHLAKLQIVDFGPGDKKLGFLMRSDVKLTPPTIRVKHENE